MIGTAWVITAVDSDRLYYECPGWTEEIQKAQCFSRRQDAARTAALLMRKTWLVECDI